MPEFPIVGDPARYVTWLPEPEASIVSAESTVTRFWIPDTITPAAAGDDDVVLVMTLTLTLSPGVCGIVPGGLGLTEWKLGMGNMLGRPLRETWCALKRKMPIGAAITPVMETAIAIQRIRPWERLGGLENESR